MRGMPSRRGHAPHLVLGAWGMNQPPSAAPGVVYSVGLVPGYRLPPQTAHPSEPDRAGLGQVPRVRLYCCRICNRIPLR